MPIEQFEVRVSFRKLLIALCLTIVPICAVGWYTITRTQQAVEESIGAHFRTVAGGKASEVSQFIHDRVVTVGALAAAPAVVEAVRAANRASDAVPHAEVEARIARIERTWNTPEADALVKTILSASASQVLQRYREVDRRFLRITLTDAKGATIAATHKTLDYFQADEEFWLAIQANGRGAVHLTDVLYDEVTHSNYIGIGAPVMESTTNRFLGALDALIDVGQVLAIVDKVPLGRGVRSNLVKDDGTVISGGGTSLAMKVKSEELAAVREVMQTPAGRERGFQNADVGGRRVLIGYADTGLRNDYRQLGWTVLVAQDWYEAVAPVRGLVRLVALLVFVGLLGVTFAAVYFSLHRPRPITDIGGAVGTARSEQTVGSGPFVNR